MFIIGTLFPDFLRHGFVSGCVNNPDWYSPTESSELISKYSINDNIHFVGTLNHGTPIPVANDYMGFG